MMCRVLGAHPKILGMNELHFFGDTISDIALAASPINRDTAIRQSAEIIARQKNGIWGAGAGPEEFALASEILPPNGEGYTSFLAFERTCNILARQAGKQMACEQTPRNIFYAADLLKHLPRAKIIHLVRDPRAVVASQKYRWRRKALGGGNIPWSEVIRVWANYHPLTISKLWQRAASAGEQLKGHPNYLQVKFEDVIRKPNEILPEICRFIGVEFFEGMMDVPMVGSSQRSDRGGKGFSPESIDSWRQTLGKCEKRIIEMVLGKYLDHYGYERTQARCLLGLVTMAAKYPLHILAAAMANPRRFLIQARAYLGARRIP